MATIVPSSASGSARLFQNITLIDFPTGRITSDKLKPLHLPPGVLVMQLEVVQGVLVQRN
jgi:hypothetical protein